jgi:hypothetical protein
MTAYLAGELSLRIGKSQERAVLRFLSGRLGKLQRKRAPTTGAHALAA